MTDPMAPRIPVHTPQRRRSAGRASGSGPTRYDLIVFESFAHKGQKRQRAWRVGSAVASPKGGMVLYIPAGISLTGRVMVVPEKTPLNEMDLLEAYQSVADEHGL